MTTDSITDGPSPAAASALEPSAPGQAGGLGPESRKDAKVESPLKRVASSFAESTIALIGLGLLLVIVFVAVFAPVLAPQNPYDLTQIDVNDARLPPGADKLAPAVTNRWDVTIDPATGAVSLDLDDRDGTLFETFSVTAEPVVEAAATAVRLSVTVDPPEALARIEELRVDPPRGVTLSAGEKHSFRSFWTLTPDQLDGLELRRDVGVDQPFEFEIRMTGSAGEALMTFWLGTDGQGRDMLSAIMYGLRTSLAVGVMSGFAALIIGMSLGLTAAYFGGRVDTVIMRVVDLQLSFPAILVALMLLAILGRGTEKLILALIIVQWAYYARTSRSAALVERRREYIEAAQCLALSKARVIFRHLLPNCLPPVIVVGTVQVANAIALEATLSFLGIGLPITEPSLGLLISNGFDYMMSGRYWISFFPGVALLVTIVSINLVGDQLRDVLNPRLQR